MAKIKKAVIPVAGLGLNFLPATKATAKEMLPIVDKPILQFVIEEAQASGIKEFILVTGGHKQSIEDHFDSNVELEQNLKAKNKNDLLEITQATTLNNIFYVRQARPIGLGDAILQARDFINDDPFVVLLADNIMVSDQPLTEQLMAIFEQHGENIVAMQSSDKVEDLSSYGVLDGVKKVEDDLYHFDRLVEKPKSKDFQDAYASIGRYVFTADIFDYLESQEPGVDGQIQLTDAIDRMNQDQKVLAYDFQGDRYDVGDLMGYLKANLLYGLHHPETQEELKNYLKEYQ